MFTILSIEEEKSNYALQNDETMIQSCLKLTEEIADYLKRVYYKSARHLANCNCENISAPTIISISVDDSNAHFCHDCYSYFCHNHFHLTPKTYSIPVHKQKG